jgi:hypothetical protein
MTVIATDAISIAGRDREGFRSSIGSNALLGLGDAGDIFIATPSLEMRDGFISTGTFRESRGNAGDLRLEVGRLTLTDGARISSSTEGSGQGGGVEITVADSIVNRRSESGWQSERCVQRNRGTRPRRECSVTEKTTRPQRWGHHLGQQHRGRCSRDAPDPRGRGIPQPTGGRDHRR